MIVGGVALSTLLTVLVVPSIYLLIGGFTKPPNYVGEMLDKLRAREGAGDADAPAQQPAE